MPSRKPKPPEEVPQRILQMQAERMERRLKRNYLLATGGELSRSLIARHLKASPETVRSWMTGRRRPPPDIIRDLARLAETSPVESFADLGWLDATDLAMHFGPASDERGDDPLADGAAPARCAPEAAACALLRDEAMRRRFTVELATIESSGAYPFATDAVAQFRPRRGAARLELADAEHRAQVARLVGVPSPDLMRREPHYCAVRLELAAFLADPLRRRGQYTWQGDPGSRTWEPFAAPWPAQLLVQDIVSGQSRDADSPWTARDDRPLIFIGGRYSTGIAAALAAQGLGWQFVLVHSGAMIGHAGHVAATRRDWLNGPADAWSEAHAHMRERSETGKPWQAVLSVRPHSFVAPDGSADLSAIEQLRHCPGRVVYARPSEAVLDWWTARQIGLSSEGEYAPSATAHRAQLRAAFARIEQTLRERAAAAAAQDREDLVVALPEPAGPLDPYRPELPGAVVDDQVRLAWQCVAWLGRTSWSASPAPAKSLRPGVLRRYQDELGADRVPQFPRVFDPDGGGGRLGEGIGR